MSMLELLAMVSSGTEPRRMRTIRRLHDEILGGGISRLLKTSGLCMNHEYRKCIVCFEPVSVAIDQKGVIYMWTTGTFEDMACISTGVPTYEEGSCLKDGHLEYYIDIDHEGKFYQNKKYGDKYQRKTLCNGVEDIIKLARDDPNLLLSTVESEIFIEHEIRSTRSAVDFTLKRADYRVSFGAVGTCEYSYMCFSILTFSRSPGCISCSSRISDYDRFQPHLLSLNTVCQINDDATLLLECIRARECIKLQILNPSDDRSLTNGTYCGRPVIVQRIPMVNGFDSDSNSEELKALKSCGHLPCILGSFTVNDDHFEYRGSEPFLDSLEGYVTSSTNLPNKTLEDFMRDTTKALLSLHQVNMIHGDLQPSNVKICEGSSNDSLTAKVTGMTGGGSFAKDFVDLGHVSFFALTKGKFPFGDTLKDNADIKTARRDLFENYPEACDLIFNVLLRQKSSPTDAEVSLHPFLFDSEKVALFFMATSECIQHDNNNHSLSKKMQTICHRVFGVNLGWGQKLNEGVFRTNNYYGGYNFYNTWSLLLAIRNGMAHPLGNIPDIQAVLGKSASEIGTYYRMQFPKLLIEVYKVMRKDCKNKEFRDVYFNW